MTGDNMTGAQFAHLGDNLGAVWLGAYDQLRLQGQRAGNADALLCPPENSCG